MATEKEGCRKKKLSGKNEKQMHYDLLNLGLWVRGMPKNMEMASWKYLGFFSVLKGKQK